MSRIFAPRTNGKDMQHDQVFTHTHLILLTSKDATVEARYRCLFTVEQVWDADVSLGHEAHVFQVDVHTSADGLPGVEGASFPVTLSPKSRADNAFRLMLAAECLSAWADGSAKEDVPDAAIMAGITATRSRLSERTITVQSPAALLAEAA